MSTYVSLVDSVQSRSAGVTSDGQLRVEAAIPDTVTVAGTVSVAQPVEVSAEASSSVEFDQVSIGSGSATELSGAVIKNGFLVRNMDSTRTVFVGIGSTDPTPATGFPIPPGTTWQLPVPTDAEIRVICEASYSATVAYMSLG